VVDEPGVYDLFKRCHFCPYLFLSKSVDNDLLSKLIENQFFNKGYNMIRMLAVGIGVINSRKHSLSL